MNSQTLYILGFIGFVVILIVVWLITSKKKDSESCSSTQCTANTLAIPGARMTPDNYSEAAQWCKLAKRTLKKVVQSLGAPDDIDNSQGGMAVWKKPKECVSCLDRIEVRDSGFNRNHLYAYLDIDLPAALVTEVRKLAPGVQYNTAARQLIINCRDLESAIIIAVVAKRMVTSQLRSEDARMLVVPWILELRNSRDKKGDMEAYNYEICKYKNSLSLDYMNDLSCMQSSRFPCGVCQY